MRRIDTEAEAVLEIKGKTGLNRMRSVNEIWNFIISKANDMGLTGSSLSRIIYGKGRQIYTYINGGNLPSLTRLVEIATILEVSVDDILFKEDYAEPTSAELTQMFGEGDD